MGSDIGAFNGIGLGGCKLVPQKSIELLSFLFCALFLGGDDLCLVAGD